MNVAPELALTEHDARQFASTALSHVTREFPTKPDHVLGCAADVQIPRVLHPVFFGSFDWHSCVHGYWLLARIRRLLPHLEQSIQIRELFDLQLTAQKIAVEQRYLTRADSATFERPYGWAWLLALAEELRRTELTNARWHEALRPFAQDLARRFREYLPKQTYPIRSGAHFNSAFAMTWVLRYAQGAGDSQLAALVRSRASDWFGQDNACQAWEPSGDDFLSPALMEAALMREVLTRDDFIAWFLRFLPELDSAKPACLFTPAEVTDRTDGKIAHLDGLNLSRAWCWRLIAKGFPGDHPIALSAQAAAKQHLAAALPHLAAHYMGAHWLSSFALLALTPQC